MPLNTITCPNCKARLRPAKPVEEGARVKCPKCQTAFTAEEDAAEAMQPKAPAEPAAKPPAPSRAANKPRPKAAPKAEEVDDAEDVIDAEDDEDSGRRKSKKGGKGMMAAIPLWGWLVGGGVGLFLLCGCAGCAGVLLTGGGGGLGNTVTEENLGKIKMRMTEAEVIQILGKPTTPPKPQGFGKVDRWDHGGDFIEIQFENDRAVYRKYSFTSTDGVMTKKSSGEGGLW